MIKQGECESHNFELRTMNELTREAGANHVG